MTREEYAASLPQTEERTRESTAFEPFEELGHAIERDAARTGRDLHAQA
jgi:hypothetical protein